MFFLEKANDSLGPAPPPSDRQADRILGYDFARAVAILGMVAVHFILVMAKDQGRSNEAGYFVLDLLDGRAAALFVVLAGIGVTLRAKSAVATENPEKLRQVQATLVRRGMFLLAAGFLNLVIWPGDILRVYGVSLLFVPCLLTSSSRRLLTAALFFPIAFTALLGVFDYERHWDWTTMEYHDLWTADGLVRNLFYNGFRAVFPWTGLLLFGMWLGRFDLRASIAKRRMLAWGGGIWLAAELVSRALLTLALRSGEVGGGRDAESIRALLGTGSMPPLPLFLLASGGLSVAIIALSLMLAEARRNAGVVQAFVATGQLAFTWYMAHIILGLGAIEGLGLTGTQSPEVALLAAVGFFATALGASWAWRKFARHGPLEWLMRKACG